MHSDSYRTYIKSLNATPSYYPFGEMRTLVMNHNGRRRSVFAPFFRYAAGLGLLALLVGGIFFVNTPSNTSRIAHSIAMTSRTAMPSATNGSIIVPKRIVSRNNAVRLVIVENSSYVPTESISKASTTTQSTTQNITEDHQPSQSNVPTSKVPAAAPVSAAIRQISDQNGSIANHWTAFVSGGALLPSNTFSTSSIFGAAGVRYPILGSSALVAELRRTSFVVNRAGQNGGFRDTTFIVGGHSTTNTIGTSSQSSTTSNSFVNSLDLGYRYVLEPNNMLSPSAEILAGASTFGFLSSEAAGVEYRFTNSLSLDLSARAEQMFSPKSAPLTALGFEAGIAFQW